MVTIRELSAAIIALDDAEDYGTVGGYLGDVLWGDRKIVTPFGVVRWEEEFGGEGQGDDMWIVFSLTNDSDVRYFKVDGYYSSWDGGSWEDEVVTEVEPREVVVTKWFKI